jgi:predicted DNA binding protein
MWVLKLEKTAENTFIASTAQKHNVSFSGYPINHQVRGNRVIVNVAGFIEGNPADIERFVQSVRKEKEMVRIQCNDNFVLATLNLEAAVAVLYDPRIIFVQPAKYGKNGTEILELASWEKEPLMRLVELFKKMFNCKVLSFTQKKIRSIGLISIHPDLTEKQRRALQLAVQHGYYAFPRKITLEKLAQIMGVSFSTYQAHLAKAEAHFVPEMVGKFL